MGKVSFVQVLKKSSLQLVISLFLGTSLLAGCMGGGTGTVPGAGNVALDGPPKTTQDAGNGSYSTPMDEIAVAPTADHITYAVVMNCINGKCPIKSDIGDILGASNTDEEWDGCYEIVFKLSLQVGPTIITDQVVRVIETSQQLYKDFYIDASGVVEITVEVGPGKNFEFFNTHLRGADVNVPALGGLPWAPCPGTYPTMACILPTFKYLMKSLDESCSFLSKPTIDFKFPFLPPPELPKIKIPDQK